MQVNILRLSMKYVMSLRCTTKTSGNITNGGVKAAKTLVNERKRYYLLGLIDDCTRLCHVEIIDKIRAAEVILATSKSLKWFLAHGITTEEIMTDNGVEFTCYTSQRAKDTHFFETMLKIFNIKHRYTKPYRPQTNGKISYYFA